jgi:site-specific recombinase XerD
MKTMNPRWTGYQSAMATNIQAYLAYKRAMGRRYATQERSLRLLDRFLYQRHVEMIEDVTPELLESFLASRPLTGPRSFNSLLGAVRHLFDWLVVQGTLASSPLQVSPQRQTQRRLPFLFDQPLARRLLDAAAALPAHNTSPFRGPTYHVVFAIMYTLGLRISEAAHVHYSDVDLEHDILTVREGKFGKSRLLPFGPRMSALLKRYMEQRRARGLPSTPETPLFSLKGGRRISTNAIGNVFRDHLIPQLGVKVPAGMAKPRVHCLRYSFAVGALLRWYRQGINPSVRLPHLSTVMGHVNLAATAYYLTVTAELMKHANDRFESYVGTLLRPEEVKS